LASSRCPDELDAAFLRRALKGKKTPIKSALLDQRVIAGLGNIYVCEALWRARISPKRSAAQVNAEQVARLVPAIKAVLKEAVKAGGSSAARSQAGRRRARLFPEELRGVRPRRDTLSRAARAR
jgi:formamidopyrimidine-DNA glycosylase